MRWGNRGDMHPRNCVPGSLRPPKIQREQVMGISPNPIAMWLAALVGSVATAAFGQSTPVLMGPAAYGDWRVDAPGVRRKITPADRPPPYATASANNGPTLQQR